MRGKILSLIILLAVIVMSVSVGAIAMTPLDADIVVTNMRYSEALNMGDPVNISVDVMNIGEGWRSPYVYLYVNGVEFWSRYIDPIRPNGGVDTVEFPSSLTGLYMPSVDLRMNVKSGWLVEPGVISDVTHEYDFTIDLQGKPDFLVVVNNDERYYDEHHHLMRTIEFSVINIGDLKATNVEVEICVAPHPPYTCALGELRIGDTVMIEEAWSGKGTTDVYFTVTCDEGIVKSFHCEKIHDVKWIR